MRAMQVIGLGAMLASGIVIGGCSESGAGPSPGPARIDINGTVVDGELQPLAGVPVLVTGHAQVTTDAHGQFSVPGVETPYDVATVLGNLRFATVYKNLTRSDPVLMVSVTNLATHQTHYGGVSGMVTGVAGYPEAYYHRTAVLFDSPEATYATGADYSGAYQMALIDWRGTSTTTGTVHALHWRIDSATLLPAEYVGYGTRAGVVLSSGGNVTGQDVTLSPVGTMAISGTATVPTGYGIVSRGIVAGFGPAPTAPPAWTLLSDTKTASEFTYAAPSLPGAVLTVRITASAATGFAPRATAARTVTSENAAALAIVVPPAPELVAPADDATGVTAGATLSWRGMPGSVYVVTIFEEGASDPSRVHLITTDTTAVIPDLGALGLPLTASMSYAWLVSAIGPFASIDDAAGGTAYFLPGDGSSSLSADRHFTTAP